MAPADFAVVRKGYDPDAVRSHIDRLADELRRSRADAEAARLETERLRRDLEDARAELATEPHTNEAIAILGDEANRVIHAAQESSKEIVAAAEAAADDIRAKAREEASRIAEESRRESEDFGGRLVGQADEVRAKLRDEIRRARLEFAEEADRMRADARYEAESIVERAREEARELRNGAEAVAEERQDHIAALASERLAGAEAAADACVAEAAARAEALVAEAEAARAAVLTELHSHRETLEAHVLALQDAHGRARADLSAVQTLLAGLAAELEHVRLREFEVPPLTVEFDVPMASAAVAAEPEPEAADHESGDEAVATADEDDAGGDGDVEGAGAGVDEADPDPDSVAEEDEWMTPGDAEIDALFERVVAQRDDPGTATEEPVPAVRAVAGAVEEDDDWGFADDAEAALVGEAESGESGETRRRVLAALHQLAVDTGEVPVAVAPQPAGGNGNGNGAASAAAVAVEDEPVETAADADDSEALDLVPALTRKVKRALQEVENAARDADPDVEGVDVIGVFVAYLGAPAAEAMALGAGGAHGGDLGDDAEVVVRVVCGSWADELGAGLAGADAAAVATAVRDARGDAERVAVDLARTAYRAGRERASRPAG